MCIDIFAFLANAQKTQVSFTLSIIGMMTFDAKP